ncbi:E2 [Human papillomavirus type 177]|nr:E2 [Human papillomavirus type 177]
MEALSQRLNACQEKILELYERDSDKLSDQIEHWKLTRYECVLLYKAREMGISSICHQVVPVLSVSENKGHQAIELQLALEGLNLSAFNTEPWTLQATSYELWSTPPKQCFKKGGKMVEVRYDGNKDNATQYTAWTYIYYYGDTGWCKVNGKIDYYGLYYYMDGFKQYYVQFKDDCKLYATTGTYEVFYCGQVINCPESVSSTNDEVSSVETSGKLQHTHTSTTDSCNNSRSTQEAQGVSPTSRKRCRQFDSDTCDSGPVVSGDPLHIGAPRTNGQWTNSDPNTAPIVHLKGDANVLKCLRYRLENKHKHLYVNVSSTWHWTSNTSETKHAIVTIIYDSDVQRQNFLNTVKLPNSVSVSTGVMSL